MIIQQVYSGPDGAGTPDISPCVAEALEFDVKRTDEFPYENQCTYITFMKPVTTQNLNYMICKTTSGLEIVEGGWPTKHQRVTIERT